jgi:NAD(P)-dependent dehydrogenase (short-subunit alcohol dehydrogenase family)
MSCRVLGRRLEDALLVFVAERAVSRGASTLVGIYEPTAKNSQVATFYSDRRKPLLELEWDEIDRYWDTYVQSAFTLMRAVVPGMRERGFGRIVHVLTTAIWGVPPQGTAGYVAGKSALWGLGKAMAAELAP